MHAHISSVGTDCDGTHYYDYDVYPTDAEMADSFGDLHFADRVLTLIVSTCPMREATVTIRRHDDDSVTFEYHEPTDEGYRHVTAEIHKV